MSRAQRLLDLIQILRRHRFPVTGTQLAEELGISLRTLYRDIATLQEQGACIAGEPGLGYVLKPGFILPPLMFSEEEIAATGSHELAFAVENNQVVDTMAQDWQERGIHLAQAPTVLDFGYTFVGFDPDGHRLRVFAPASN